MLGALPFKQIIGISEHLDLAGSRLASYRSAHPSYVTEWHLSQVYQETVRIFGVLFHVFNVKNDANYKKKIAEIIIVILMIINYR